MSDEREDAVAPEPQNESQQTAEIEDLEVSEAESSSVLGGFAPHQAPGGFN
jgi:hypothetical protein